MHLSESHIIVSLAVGVPLGGVCAQVQASGEQCFSLAGEASSGTVVEEDMESLLGGWLVSEGDMKVMVSAVRTTRRGVVNIRCVRVVRGLFLSIVGMWLELLGELGALHSIGAERCGEDTMTGGPMGFLVRLGS
jgi:hypothetical protein